MFYFNYKKNMYDMVKQKTPKCIEIKGEQRVKRPYQNDKKCNYYT